MTSAGESREMQLGTRYPLAEPSEHDLGGSGDSREKRGVRRFYLWYPLAYMASRFCMRS
jgi:hypothetical protein